MNLGRVRPVAVVVRATSIAGGDPASMVDYPAMTDLTVALGFDDMYAREYPGLIAVASALTGHREDAQDLVHDTMVRALVRWDRVSRLDRPGAWCHHVLVNAVSLAAASKGHRTAIPFSPSPCRSNNAGAVD